MRFDFETEVAENQPRRKHPGGGSDGDPAYGDVPDDEPEPQGDEHQQDGVGLKNLEEVEFHGVFYPGKLSIAIARITSGRPGRSWSVHSRFWAFRRAGGCRSYW